MAGTSSASNSLKEYLKRYTSNDVDKKRKKKKMKKSKPDSTKILIVDEDPVWQKPVNLEEDDEDSPDEDKPQLDEDIEVKRMKRLENLRLKRPPGSISEDGSGWVSVSSIPNNVKEKCQNPDASLIENRLLRNDTPSPEPEKSSDTRSGIDISALHHQGHKHAQVSQAGIEKGRSGSLGNRAARRDTPSPVASSDSDGLKDLSPVRRKQRDDHVDRPEPQRTSSHPQNIDSDISPPRRSRHDSRQGNDWRSSVSEDLSPPRKVKRDRSSFLDPAHANSDLSPPRKERKGSTLRFPSSKTGLISGADIKDENSRKKQEELSRLRELDLSINGRAAAPVYRDKITGDRISKEEFMKSQRKGLKNEDKPKEIKLEWGKGLAQKREVEVRLQELESDKDKPFARSRDDPDLDAMLKARVRFGDPMAHLLKKPSEPLLANLGDNEKMKESGFIVPQTIPTHSWIKRRLEAAPNRYGIKPGRHWDGVDRSTGYEKELFKRINDNRAKQQEAYLWSVSDM